MWCEFWTNQFAHYFPGWDYHNIRMGDSNWRGWLWCPTLLPRVVDKRLVGWNNLLTRSNTFYLTKPSDRQHLPFPCTSLKWGWFRSIQLWEFCDLCQSAWPPNSFPTFGFNRNYDQLWVASSIQRWQWNYLLQSVLGWCSPKLSVQLACIYGWPRYQLYHKFWIDNWFVVLIQSGGR